MNDFWENQVDPGYYDEVLLNGLKKKSGIQSNWHNLTFLKMAKKINIAVKARPRENAERLIRRFIKKVKIIPKIGNRE